MMRTIDGKSLKKIPDYEELFPKERSKRISDSYFDAFRTIHPYTLEEDLRRR